MLKTYKQIIYHFFFFFKRILLHRNIVEFSLISQIFNILLIKSIKMFTAKKTSIIATIAVFAAIFTIGSIGMGLNTNQFAFAYWHHHKHNHADQGIGQESQSGQSADCQSESGFGSFGQPFERGSTIASCNNVGIQLDHNTGDNGLGQH